MLRSSVLAAWLCGAALSLDASTANTAAAAWHMPLERRAFDRDEGISSHVAQRLAGILVGDERAPVWGALFRSEPSRRGSHAAPHGAVPVEFEYVDLRHQGGFFATTVGIGTPPQPASLSLTLAPAGTFVMGHKLRGHQFYDHAKSSTYQRNGTHVSLGEPPHQIDGFVSRDRVSVGGIDARDYLFVELDSPDTILQRLPPQFDGMISFGPGSDAFTGGRSLVHSLIDQGTMSEPVVGVSFSERHARFLLGGIDAPHKRSDFHFYNSHKGQWAAPLAGVSVGGKAIAARAGPCAISELDVIIGPADAVDALADAVGAENHWLPCDAPAPDIVFELADGFKATLTKQQYTVEVSHGVCQFMFMGMGDMDWSLGMPFLRSVYAVLDFGDASGKDRIGLAPIQRG